MVSFYSYVFPWNDVMEQHDHTSPKRFYLLPPHFSANLLCLIDWNSGGRRSHVNRGASNRGSCRWRNKMSPKYFVCRSRKMGLLTLTFFFNANPLNLSLILWPKPEILFWRPYRPVGLPSLIALCYWFVWMLVFAGDWPPGCFQPRHFSEGVLRCVSCSFFFFSMTQRLCHNLLKIAEDSSFAWIRWWLELS